MLSPFSLRRVIGPVDDIFGPRTRHGRYSRWITAYRRIKSRPASRASSAVMIVPSLHIAVR
jgi:hypothetical protein